jgi:hypothetical protein
MADRKISDLTALTAPASGDFLPIVDISEAAAASKNKRITIEELMRGVPDGTAAAPGIAFETDPNTGIFSPGADQLAISTGGTARLTSSTTALTSALPVDVPLGAAATPSLTFTGDLNTGIYSPGADQVAAATNGTGRLFVSSTGDIQVGAAATLNAAVLSATADPASKNLYLAFNGTTTGADFLMGGISANANGTNIGTVDIYRGSSDNHGYISFRTKNGTTLGERLRITDAGLVGIGTSAATDKLHLHEASSSACYLHITNDTTGSAATNGVIVGLDSSEQFYIYSYENNSMIFGTNNAERVRLDASGRLLIGASADSGGALLQVNGDRIRVATAKTPASAADTGTAGEICWDADYIYVCTATNTWKRTAISTW